MSPKAKVARGKEFEIAAVTGLIVLNQKEGHCVGSSAGINYSAKAEDGRNVVVASLFRKEGDNIFTLICNEAIAGKIERTGLVFSRPQAKRKR